MIRTKITINYGRKVVLLSAYFVLALAVSTSCKKKYSSLGEEALDVNKLLASGGIDTFLLETYSVDEDSIPTDYQPYGTLGAIHDPKLGILNASIYTQLSIDGKIVLPTGGVINTIDSVVLSLNYGGSYGKLDAQTFEVYELTETMTIDSSYYRFSTKAINGTNLVEASSATQTPNLTAKVVVGPTQTDTLKPQLRLRLNNTLGQQFIQDILSGNSAFNSTSDFLTSGYFKGFRINVANANPANGTGAMLYINMSNSDTKLTVYFSLQGETDQRTVSLRLKGNSTFFNHVDVNRTGHHVENVLVDKSFGQTNFYAQRFGLLGVVETPTLTNLSDKAVIQNGLLYLPIESHSQSAYTPIPMLELKYKNSQGKYGSIVSVAYSSSQKGYVADLRPYLQDVVNGEMPNGPIYIFPSLSLFSCMADRVVFNGVNTPYKVKPKLVVKYTEFK
jgi:hypothetical protein